MNATASARVIRVLDQLIEMHGKPRALRVDNGPELTSITFTEWCEEHKIDAVLHRTPQTR